MMITDPSVSTPPSESPQEDITPPKTAIDAVFESLLADIVRGHYPTGTRLPAERDLAKQLGASRPTLREALRRLGEWNLIKTRRGSGIAVRDVNDWTIEVLPSYLRYAKPGPQVPSTLELIGDMLQLRRSLMGEVLSMIGGRVPPDTIPQVRKSMHHAWLSRTQKPFISADLTVLRGLVRSANVLPGLWMLNQMSEIYTDLAASMGQILAPGGGFVDAWNQVLDDLKGPVPQDASVHLIAYLTEQDARLMTLLRANC